MNKNIFLIGLGIAIVIAAGVLVFKDKPEPVATTVTETPQTENTPAVAANAEVGTDVGLEDGTLPTPAASPVIITFSDTGYSPASVTIKKGETVRYVNNSSMGTWPASANHPSHTIYPQKSASDCLGSSFDSCRDLKPGESWEFTFNEVGTWGYHDHSHAKFRGTVVVTE